MRKHKTRSTGEEFKKTSVTLYQSGKTYSEMQYEYRFYNDFTCPLY